MNIIAPLPPYLAMIQVLWTRLGPQEIILEVELLVFLCHQVEMISLKLAMPPMQVSGLVTALGSMTTIQPGNLKMPKNVEFFPK